jgi:cbb3-type cytochrome oxidase subunit 3
MSPPEISLLAVTIAFTGLVIWVYWPSHRQRLESFGSMPLDDDDSPEGSTADAGSATHPAKNPEKKKEERL